MSSDEINIRYLQCGKSTVVVSLTLLTLLESVHLYLHWQ